MMSGHIFLSYSRKDIAQAKLLANAFENIGWDVWWDREIPPGKSFDDVIEQALDGATCVVVLWSHNSINSQWVRIEAAEGKNNNILIPIQIDEFKSLPLAFRRTQVAPLINWDGDTSSEDFQRIVASISPYMSSPAPTPPVKKHPKTTPKQKQAASKPQPSPESTNKAISFKNIAAVLIGIALLLIIFKIIDPLSNTNTTTNTDQNIQILAEKEAQLNAALAKQKELQARADLTEEQRAEEERKRLQREQELLDIQAEKEKLQAEKDQQLVNAQEAERQRIAAEKEAAANAANQNNQDEQNTEEPNTPEEYWFVVTAKPSLKIRKLPKKSGKRIGLVPYGGKIKATKVASEEEIINGKAGYWLEVHYKKSRAYAFSAYLQRIDEFTPDEGNTTDTAQEVLKYTVIANPALNIRSSPDVTGKVIAKAKKGSTVIFIKGASNKQSVAGKKGYWVEIEYEGKTGYVFDAFLRRQ